MRFRAKKEGKDAQAEAQRRADPDGGEADGSRPHGAVALEQPHHGYRRLGILLERKGEKVNHKRLFRVDRAAGLSVKRKRRKRLARVGLPGFMPTRPNQQWSIDLVRHRLASGRTLRVLTVVDAFTRECLALEVDTSLPAGA
jgi:putative transposase